MSIEYSPARQTRLISRREFRRRLGGISRTTEFRLSKRGDPNWPELVQISPGLTGYVEHEAELYISARPRIVLADAEMEVGAGP